MARIAVYGSLCHGFFNFDKYLTGRVASMAHGFVKGCLYHMPLRGYPALLPGEDDVYCEILTLQGNIPQIMHELDEMENALIPNDPSNEYHRRLMNVTNIQTKTILSLPMYLFNTENPQAKDEPMIYIPHGNWPRYMRENT